MQAGAGCLPYQPLCLIGQGPRLPRPAAGSFAMATDMAVYFCEPASPWQRGTNENTNGLLRRYLPKRTNLALHDAIELAAIAEELNTRRRKTLG